MIHDSHLVTGRVAATMSGIDAASDEVLARWRRSIAERRVSGLSAAWFCGMLGWWAYEYIERPFA